MGCLPSAFSGVSCGRPEQQAGDFNITKKRPCIVIYGPTFEIRYQETSVNGRFCSEILCHLINCRMFLLPMRYGKTKKNIK